MLIKKHKTLLERLKRHLRSWERKRAHTKHQLRSAIQRARKLV